MIASASEADGLYVCFFIIIQQGGIATMNKATCNKVWLAAIAFIFALLMAGGSIVNVHAAEPAFPASM